MGNSHISWFGSMSLMARPTSCRAKEARISLADGNGSRAVRVTHVNRVIGRRRALLLEEDHLAVVADVAQIAEIEPGEVAQRLAVIAGDDYAAASDTLAHQELTFGGDVAQMNTAGHGQRLAGLARNR